MKVGIITTPNEKGQIVIPKEYRDNLGIDETVPLQVVLRGRGIHLYPIQGVIGKFDTESSYEQILKRTQGAWGPETKENKRHTARRRKIALQASQRRKQAW